MLVFATRLKRGMCVIVEGHPLVVADARYAKHGKGPMFVQAEMRDVLTGITRKVQLNLTERLEKRELITRWMHYLRSDGDDRIFADPETGEQVAVPNDFLGDDAQWLEKGRPWMILYLDGELFAVVPLFRG